MTVFAAGSDFKKGLIAAVLLSALVVIVYGQCGGFELVTYDDPGYVTNNERVMQGISAENIGWAFSSFQSSNYHPLTVVSHMLDTTLFGDSAGARHLVNVFFIWSMCCCFSFFCLKLLPGVTTTDSLRLFLLRLFLLFIRCMWSRLRGFQSAKMFCPHSSGLQPCIAGLAGQKVTTCPVMR